MVINKDVEFNEEGTWDWKVNDVEKYDFLLILNEEEEIYENHQEPIVTNLQIPMSSTSSFFFSSESSSSGTPISPSRKMRSLDDLYEVTNPINNDVTITPYLPWHIKSINHSNMTHLGIFLFIEKIHLDTLSYLHFHVEGVYRNFGRVSFIFITYQVID
jgi:hypothetical protein